MTAFQYSDWPTTNFSSSHGNYTRILKEYTAKLYRAIIISNLKVVFKSALHREKS